MTVIADFSKAVFITVQSLATIMTIESNQYLLSMNEPIEVLQQILAERTRSAYDNFNYMDRYATNQTSLSHCIKTFIWIVALNLIPS